MATPEKTIGEGTTHTDSVQQKLTTARQPKKRVHKAKLERESSLRKLSANANCNFHTINLRKLSITFSGTSVT